MTSSLRLGVLSTARIARSFVDALKASTAVRVDAVASRTQAGADAFAAQHGVARAHGSYEALLADKAIDAIYIPLPNGMHALWAERALRAGYPVLCEKSLTPTLAEAAALFATAQECGLPLLEAFPNRYQPQMLEMKRLLDSGAVGEVRLVQSSFGFTLANAGDIRLDAALGGGALLDAGCYALSFARLAIGRRPLSVSAQARWGATGVDMAMSGTVQFEGGAVAQIGCTMDTAVHRSAKVIGSAGVIETDYLNHTTDERPGYLRLRSGTGWTDDFKEQPFARGNGFRFEAEHFAAVVQNPTAHAASYAADRQMSLDNAATLEALLRSAREGREVAVSAPR